MIPKIGQQLAHFPLLGVPLAGGLEGLLLALGNLGTFDKRASKPENLRGQSAAGQVAG